MTQETQTKRKRARGVVKSDKMDKTITVTVQRLVKDPRYGKYLRRKATFMAHNPHNYAREGDLVEIESTRPLSRRKCWRLVRILRRGADQAGPGPDEVPAPEPNSEDEATP